MDLSFWEKDVFFPQFDALIIGSGLVGLNAAIHLQELQPSWRIAIVERGSLPLGASTRNAGFACFGSPTELLGDLEAMGEDKLFALVEKRFRGIQLLRKRLGDDQIGYQPEGGYEVFLAEDQLAFEAASEKLPYFNQMLFPIFNEKAFSVEDKKCKELGINSFQHLIAAPFEGMIHPGRMVQSLLDWAKQKNISFFNGLTIDSIEAENKGFCLPTQAGFALHSKRVLVCTNGFSKQLLPAIALRPARNQVILTEPIPGLKVRGCFHYKEGYVYFRNVGDRLLLGGFRHLDPSVETTTEFGYSPNIQRALEDFLYTHLLPEKSISITHRWSGIMGIGPTKEPILEEVMPGLWAAIRLGGMGVAIGTQLGMEAGELISRFDN